MNEQLFNVRQIFNLKPKTLEKRLTNFYQETRDEKSTLKYLIAIQVRDELGVADLSFFMKSLVRDIFLKTKTTSALRRYYIYFKEYFDAKEWKQLTIRLFSLRDVVVNKLKALYTQFIEGPLQGLAGS